MMNSVLTVIEQGSEPPRSVAGSNLVSLAWLVFIVWFAASAGILWIFFFSGVYAHSHAVMMSFNGGMAAQRDFEQWVKSQRGDKTGSLVIHVVDSECPCEQNAAPARRAFDRAAAAQGVAVHLIAANSAGRTAHQSPQSWNVPVAQLRKWFSASPALAIVDAQGKLAYAGPLATNGVCESDSNGLNLVDFIRPNHPDTRIVPLAAGCFCPI